MNKREQNKWILASAFGILINLVWLMMSFGIIAANATVILAMLSISLISAVSLFKNLGVASYKDMKNNLHIVQKIGSYLTYFVILMAIFGQIVFGWYLLLYYVMALGLVYLNNPQLFHKLK